MPARQKQREQLRTRIALEAARLMVESGIRDYQLAKRKAADRLGVSEARWLPANQEIEQAVREYRSLFQADTQPQVLQSLRQTAIEAMQFFATFRPRLVGDVLHGSAGEHSCIELHLFAATPEQVCLFLMENGIPYEEKQKRLRMRADQFVFRPMFSFVADDVVIELVVFAESEVRHAPLSPVNGKPMQRADIRSVEALL